MFRAISLYGLIAGLIVDLPLFLMTVATKGEGFGGMLLGYTIMLVALSTVFVAIKRHRDLALGGVIGFWPALGMGLGISVIAGIFYALAWDLALAAAHLDFAGDYAKAMIAAEKAKGVSGPALQKAIHQWQAWADSYGNPLYRWSESFTEIFPVGVLVSLVSAGLLSNRRFLPARGG